MSTKDQEIERGKVVELSQLRFSGIIYMVCKERRGWAPRTSVDEDDDI